MGIYRLVTIAKNRDTPGLNGPVEVSEVHARPPLTRRPTKNDINKRAVTLSTQEGTNATQIHDDSTSTWTLRVHADCWEMVSCRVADPGAFAAKWTDALISLNEEFFSTGKGPKIPRLILSPTTIAAGTKNYRRQGHQRLETFDGLALELGLKSLPASTSPMGLDQLEAGFYARDHLSLPTINSNDPFSKLPKEIRESIIAYAATKDLPNLRLASRQIAIISCLSALKMSFWLSRFLPAFEMGFALPEIYDPELDFRALYFLIIRACDKPLVPGNEGEGNLVKRLTKRRYWWNSLSAVVAL
ncbi:hypothetical protein QBC35DRAFT_380513 [Podospora australis]|uniref:F-box domain-containing protein n=1 Tax=Podospora australis TaxID=1536484 RepID=A0AAN6WW93_9PEZI|nr:hypothetical protein QBC35DRAFT_380513 [Podospora australis]